MPIHTVLLTSLLLILISFLACGPSAGKVSGATKSELDRACTALSRAGYDYYKIDVLSVGGRITEVSADIHVAHPGPAKTKKYCEGR